MLAFTHSPHTPMLDLNANLDPHVSSLQPGNLRFKPLIHFFLLLPHLVYDPVHLPEILQTLIFHRVVGLTKCIMLHYLLDWGQPTA